MTLVKKKKKKKKKKRRKKKKKSKKSRNRNRKRSNTNENVTFSPRGGFWEKGTCFFLEKKHAHTPHATRILNAHYTRAT